MNLYNTLINIRKESITGRTIPYPPNKKYVPKKKKKGIKYIKNWNNI